jgi:G3E family GTPase
MVQARQPENGGQAMDHSRDERIPVTILTGFLGSGKTTILNHLLKRPDLTDTAVIVNEFGAVGLDHLLIEQAFEDAVLLKNGCICCTVRGDIADTLDLLRQRVAAGEIPPFRRIAIETTGLADPAPVAHTLAEQHFCRLDGIVTAVDALHAPAQLTRQHEAQSQVALADRILLTKTDLVTAEALAAATMAIRSLNPAAPLCTVLHGSVAPEDVFGLAPDGAARRPRRWLSATFARHESGIGAALITADQPVAVQALRLWLDSLLSVRGDDVLRLKGLAGATDVLVLQAVHHVVHPPVWLPPRPDLPGRTEIVVIGRGLSAAGLRESFAAAREQADTQSARAEQAAGA